MMAEMQRTSAFPALSESEPARPLPWLWPVLAMLFLATTGLLAFLLWIQRWPAEGSPEVTFSRDMAAHHQQAVEMAFLLRERSTDEELRRFALDILLTQQAQIGQMQGWLAAWGQPLSGPGPVMGGQAEMMGMASRGQVNELQTLPVPETEVSFLQLMIRHHQGGVMMAQEALSQTNRPEVVRLATAILNGQQSEIEYMQGLLEKRGAAPPEPLEPMQMDHSGS